MMKKLLTGIVVAMLVMGLSSCAEETNAPPGVSEKNLYVKTFTLQDLVFDVPVSHIGEDRGAERYGCTEILSEEGRARAGIGANDPEIEDNVCFFLLWNGLDEERRALSGPVVYVRATNPTIGGIIHDEVLEFTPVGDTDEEILLNSRDFLIKELNKEFNLEMLQPDADQVTETLMVNGLTVLRFSLDLETQCDDPDEIDDCRTDYHRGWMTYLNDRLYIFFAFAKGDPNQVYFTDPVEEYLKRFVINSMRAKE
jgi:hypothetical protein